MNPYASISTNRIFLTFGLYMCSKCWFSVEIFDDFSHYDVISDFVLFGEIGDVAVYVVVTLK